MNRNELCWCGSGKKYKRCHMDFDAKISTMRFSFLKGQSKPPHEIINNDRDVAGIKKSGVVNDGVLDLMAELIKPGVTTEQLDNAAADYMKKHNAVSATLNYGGFPKSICTSVNDVVCHGIPSPDVVLKEGDIINVDSTTIVDGYYADASRMYIVGGVTTPNAKRLVEVTKECMEIGIAAIKPWGWLGDIGAAVGAHAGKNGYSVVTDLGGHGVGKKFHLEPFVQHTGRKETGMLLVPGMVLTVEPMINEGKKELYIDEVDNWTARTKDGKLSAQWEKTVLITEKGTEILSS